MKNLVRAYTCIVFILSITFFASAQTNTNTIGYSTVLKPKLGMNYEYDEALKYYTQTFRKDSAWAVRVLRILGGPRNGCDLLSVPLKTWDDLDLAKRPYQSDASLKAWMNVLKYCDNVSMDYFSFDQKNSNPLSTTKPETKYLAMYWIVDPKADGEAFAKEFAKVGPLLKKGGYKFSITHSLSGSRKYAIIMALENGFKDFNIKLPEYKELFTKAFTEKDAYRTHMSIIEKSTVDYYSEYRTIRTGLSTR